jgi:hypothetical protein
MIQQNIQSTKVLTAALPMATSLDVSPSQEPSNTLTNVVFAVIVSTSNISKSPTPTKLASSRSSRLEDTTM